MSSFNTMADLLTSFKNFREFDQFCIFQILCCIFIISMGFFKSFEKNLLYKINAVAKQNGAQTSCETDYDDGKLWYMIAALGLHCV